MFLQFRFLQILLTMKKVSIVIAALALAVFVFDLLAMLQHWTFNYSKEASTILLESGADVSPNAMAGLPALSFLLFAIASFLGYQASKHQVFNVSGIIFLVMLIGYMFKIMHWPGAGVLLVLSFGAFIFVTIPWFTAYLLQDHEPEIHVVPDEETEKTDV